MGCMQVMHGMQAMDNLHVHGLQLCEHGPACLHVCMYA